jgi:hypothetical protein
MQANGTQLEFKDFALEDSGHGGWHVGRGGTLVPTGEKDRWEGDEGNLEECDACIIDLTSDEGSFEERQFRRQIVSKKDSFEESDSCIIDLTWNDSDAEGESGGLQVYLLYWYKSTNTGTLASSKVQILTQHMYN